MSQHDYHQMLQELPGYNMKGKASNKPLWNLDFQRYYKPTCQRVLEQDQEGGALAIMLIAGLIGFIVMSLI